MLSRTGRRRRQWVVGPLYAVSLLVLKAALLVSLASTPGDRETAGLMAWLVREDSKRNPTPALFRQPSLRSSAATLRLRGGGKKKKGPERRKRFREWDSSRGVLEVREVEFGEWKRTYAPHEERLGSAAPVKVDQGRGAGKKGLSIWELGRQLRAQAAAATGKEDGSTTAGAGAQRSDQGPNYDREEHAIPDILSGFNLIKHEFPSSPAHISRTRRREISALSEAGNASAAYERALCHTHGMGGFLRDPGAALRWYERAAARGHADAQFRAGVCHMEGFGTPPSARLALQRFERAAAAGHGHAAVNAGLMLLLGRCGAVNETAGTAHLAAAARSPGGSLQVASAPSQPPAPASAPLHPSLISRAR